MKRNITSILAVVLFLQMVPKISFTQEVLSLSGKWRIALDGNAKDWPNKTGETSFWYKKELPLNDNNSLLNQIYFKNATFNTNDFIVLPGSTDEAQIGLVLEPSNGFTPGLERRFSYDGAFWIQREIEIPPSWKGKTIELFMERTLGASKVFWDDNEAGSDYGYAFPHTIIIDTATNPGKHRLTILINKDDNRYEQTGHQVTNANGTSWNGIVGKIELRAFDNIGYFKKIQVYPDLSTGNIRVIIPVVTDQPHLAKTVRISVTDPGENHPCIIREVTITGDTTVATIVLNKPVKLWNEFMPNLYQIKCELIVDEKVTDTQPNTFGVRSLTTESGYICVNGKRTIMRGTLECGSFPLTGYPAMTKNEWSKIFGTIKDYGLNMIRFHTWCPPEAAFEAADQSGIYLQPELCGRPYAELERILHTYGNHPSFCLLSLNNEAFSHNTETRSILDRARKKDSRHLYTCTSHPLGISCTDDFYVSAWGNEKQEIWPFHKMIVGITWGGGDVVNSCRFNTNPPETASDFRHEIAGINAPVIAHEMGQWAMFPELSEIETYQQGVLRNTNYERIRNAIEMRGLKPKAPNLALASGKFSALLYKEEIESILRTQGYAGFQLLGLNDFQGQYISIVGVLDDLWQSKGIVEPVKHKQYCNAVVPLLRMNRRVWLNNETFTAQVEVNNVSAQNMENVKLRWILTNDDQQMIASGELPRISIPDTGLTYIGDISIKLNKISKASKLTLKLTIPETIYSNEWEIWVYPAKLPAVTSRDVFTTSSLKQAKLWLDEGKKVLYLVDSNNSNKLRSECFSTVFWNSIHKWPQKAHTMGILCNPEHPVFNSFPTDFHSNWQWWDITMHAKAMVMNDLPLQLEPLIGVIDSYIVNDKLGYLWEARVGTGKLMVCSISFDKEMQNRPASKQLYFSLITYLKSNDFDPKTVLDNEIIEKLFTEIF